MTDVDKKARLVLAQNECIKLCRKMATTFTMPPCGGPVTKRWANKLWTAGCELASAEKALDE